MFSSVYVGKSAYVKKHFNVTDDVGCVGRPRRHFESVLSSSSHMAINHVLLLVTKVKPCWQKELLGWVTSCEIGVVGFFLFLILFLDLKAPMRRWNCQTVQLADQP